MDNEHVRLLSVPQHGMVFIMCQVFKWVDMTWHPISVSLLLQSVNYMLLNNYE